MTPPALAPSLDEQIGMIAREIRLRCGATHRYDAQLAAILASLTRLKAMEWQPIETAPKDGTVFLSFGMGHGNRIFSHDANEKSFPMFSICKWRWHDGERDEPVGDGLFKKVPCRILEGWDVEWSYTPTHWKPLDAPKEAE